jgi:molybdenum cofactor guanylyltransferase
MRMGTDKASLKLEGRSLLERAVNTLGHEVDDIFVSVGHSQVDDSLRSGFPLIEDQFENIGPVAGILSAHLHDPSAAWLVIACDMLLLDASIIHQLIAGRAADHDATAWFAADECGPEPLCAIYEPATLAALLAEVRAEGNPSPRAWLQRVRTQLLTATRPDALDGANTREEFELLAERLIAQTGAASGKT